MFPYPLAFFKNGSKICPRSIQLGDHLPVEIFPIKYYLLAKPGKNFWYVLAVSALSRISDF